MALVDGATMGRPLLVVLRGGEMSEKGSETKTSVADQYFDGTISKPSSRPPSWVWRVTLDQGITSLLVIGAVLMLLVIATSNPPT